MSPLIEVGWSGENGIVEGREGRRREGRRGEGGTSTISTARIMCGAEGVERPSFGVRWVEWMQGTT
jgi:hypothetical protein